MTYRSRFAPFFAAVLLSAAVGCDSDEPSDTMGENTDFPGDEPTDDEPMDDEPMDDTDDDLPGDDGAEDTDEPGDDGTADLFACELAESCGELFLHIDLEPAESIDCVANLTATGGPGVYRFLESLGPDLYETYIQTVVRADGTAIRQTKFRECFDCSGEEEDATEWDVRVPQLCDVEIDADAWAGCEGTGSCGEIWSYSNCVDAPELECADLDEALDG